MGNPGASPATGQPRRLVDASLSGPRARRADRRGAACARPGQGATGTQWQPTQPVETQRGQTPPGRALSDTGEAGGTAPWTFKRGPEAGSLSHWHEPHEVPTSKFHRADTARSRMMRPSPSPHLQTSMCGDDAAKSSVLWWCYRAGTGSQCTQIQLSAIVTQGVPHNPPVSGLGSLLIVVFRLVA